MEGGTTGGTGGGCGAAGAVGAPAAGGRGAEGDGQWTDAGPHTGGGMAGAGGSGGSGWSPAPGAAAAVPVVPAGSGCWETVVAAAAGAGGRAREPWQRLQRSMSSGLMIPQRGQIMTGRGYRPPGG
jgi:hypothetical protein